MLWCGYVDCGCSKRQTQDQFDEQKHKLERELEERRGELDRREQDVASREQESAALKAQVEKFPQHMEREIAPEVGRVRLRRA